MPPFLGYYIQLVIQVHDVVLGHIVVRTLGGFALYAAGDRRLVRIPCLGVCIPSQGENGGGVIGVGVRNSNILVVGGQNRSVIWRDDAGVNTLSAGNHVSDGAVERIQFKRAIYVFHVGGDAVERYRKLSEINFVGLLGDGRLSGVSGVASDVEVDGNGALGHSPAVAAVDKLDGFGVAFAFGERVGAVLGGIGISSHISVGIDGNGAGVTLRRVDNVSDAKAVREQIKGLCIVLGISIGASYRYGAFQQTGVVRIAGVDVEIFIVGLFRGRIY